MPKYHHKVNFKVASNGVVLNYEYMGSTFCMNKARRHDDRPGYYAYLQIEGVYLKSGTAVATLLIMGVTS